MPMHQMENLKYAVIEVVGDNAHITEYVKNSKNQKSYVIGDARKLLRFFQNLTVPIFVNYLFKKA